MTAAAGLGPHFAEEAGEMPAGNVTDTVLTRGTVVLDRERCKGCELCIDACPPRVLEMTTHEVNDWGFRFPVLVAGCIACQACTAICPDFCFQVYRYEEPVELPA